MTQLFFKCCIPVFEDLLPEPHNSQLLDTLFTLAHWHSMAKLRQHTEFSIEVLEEVTTQLGKVLRDFRDKTCKSFEKKELNREVSARLRRTSRNASNVSVSKNMGTTATLDRQSKALNLNTYKAHSLGDYVETIRQYGTVDSYSTEAVSHQSDL